MPLPVAFRAAIELADHFILLLVVLEAIDDECGAFNEGEREAGEGTDEAW